MRVLYTARTRKWNMELAPIAGEWVDLDEGLGEADVVSVHTPLTDETHHLIDARGSALMKPTAILVNTARGPVVDEAALADALADEAPLGRGARRLRARARDPPGARRARQRDHDAPHRVRRGPLPRGDDADGRGERRGDPRGAPAAQPRAAYRAAYASLLMVARAQGARDEADDVVQKAAIVALERLDRFEPGTNFGAWMSAIVRGVARNHRRGRKRMDERHLRLASLETQEHNPHAGEPADAAPPRVQGLGGVSTPSVAFPTGSATISATRSMASDLFRGRASF
jgi:hypothetical protein